MENKRLRFEISSAVLHILAMFFMLCDHAWSTLFPSQEWLTCVGRIAYPIFAFMIVEGYFHTGNYRKYLKRMLLFAVLSEIPFDLMYNGTLFYPFHQNVLWTFLIALSGMKLMDKSRTQGKLWKSVLACAAVVLVCTIAGFAFMTDYYGTGILLVFVFYFFRGKKWWCYLGQILGMYWINITLLGGRYYPVTVFGIYLEILQQSIALLALIPIWLYRGKQGYHAKWFQYFCYAFYPVHCLLLFMIGYFS